MSSLSPPIQSSEGFDDALIVDWIEEFRESVRPSALAPLLDFDGIDSVDVLLSPLYLAVLNTLRKGQSSLSQRRPLLESLRDWAYLAKINLIERRAVRHSAKATTTDVLLWSRDITHTAILRPVAVALLARHARCRTMACQAGVFNRVCEEDSAAVFPLAAWPEAIHRARREGARRAKAIRRIGELSIPSIKGFEAINLEPTVRATMSRLMPTVSVAITNARKALDVFQPKVLVVGNDITMEGRAGCRVAAKRGVATAVFMHGSITGDVLQASHCADQVFVYGSIHRQQLMQQGIAPERIQVCGAPNLDQRPRQTNQIHPQLQARLDMQPNDPWILVATSGPGHRISFRHHALLIRHLVKLSATFPHVPVVIKLHRKDRVDYYPTGPDGFANRKVIVVPHDAPGLPNNIFDWLQGCRIVLTGASTVALEAMVMDVPVITMDFCDEVHNVDFIDAGATTHVRTFEDLEVSVRDILAGRKPVAATKVNVASHLQAAFGDLDRRAADRGAGFLCDLFDKNGRK